MLPRGTTLHREHVKNFKIKLHRYGIDPLSSELPKHTSTGYKVATDMVRTPEVRKLQFQVANSQFSRPRINTVYHGTESTSYLGPKSWQGWFFPDRDLLHNQLRCCYMTPVQFQKRPTRIFYPWDIGSH